MLENYISNEYTRFLLILLITFLFAKIFTLFVEKVLSKLVKKSKTKLDDIIIKKTRNPLIFLIFLAGLKIALGELSTPVFDHEIATKVLTSLILITIFFVAFSFFNLIVANAFAKHKKSSKDKSNEAMYHLLEGILKVVVFIAAFLSLLSFWNVEIGPLLAGIGIGGIAIAFALQSTLGNLLGGLSIILDKSVQV
jgi:MscS family membrane protein